MREIKFRVWYKSKMWLPDGLQSYSDFMVSAFGGVFFMNEPGYHNGKDHSAILMQYTGLKDKNGKEIYEGDIVKYDQVERFGESRNNYQTTVEYKDYGFFCSCLIENIEVIGNIYENPDLLND